MGHESGPFVPFFALFPKSVSTALRWHTHMAFCNCDLRTRHCHALPGLMGAAIRHANTAAAQVLGGHFKIFDHISALPLKAISNNLEVRSTFSMPRKYQSGPALQSSKLGDLFNHPAEDGPGKGAFYLPLSTVGSSAVPPHAKTFSPVSVARGVLHMNEDNAGSLVGGGIDKCEGIENFLFVNKMTDDVAWLPHMFRKIPDEKIPLA